MTYKAFALSGNQREVVKDAALLTTGRWGGELLHLGDEQGSRLCHS